MTQSTQTQIKTLLKAGKYTEVQKILHDLFQKDLSDEEKGELYVKIFSAYMDVRNNILESRLADLESTAALLQDINVKAKEFEGAEKLKNVKKKMKQL